MKKKNWILLIWDYYDNVLYRERFYSRKQARFIMATGAHKLSSYYKYEIYKG